MTRSRTRRAVLFVLGTMIAAACALEILIRWQPFPQHLLAARDAASLTVLDRNGLLLWQAANPDGARRTWTPLAEISRHLVDATLASEDHRFFDHHGVDGLGIVRAAWLNLRGGKTGYGASTVTMQLVRLLHPDRSTRSVAGKLRQALLAARLERVADKREILEQYLNRAYFGNGAFGAEAAARLYFSTSAAALSPGQAAFLAVLPRGPQHYDPYTHLARARARQQHILARMTALHWLTAPARAVALAAPLDLRHERTVQHAPHFVDHILATLDENLRRGARVTTTLDLRLQERLEIAVSRHLAVVGGRHISQTGVIVLDNRDGGILAMVGSGDYFNRRQDGAVNVTTIRRRPGSTLKPFVYALALEAGDSPATLAYDVALPGESGETFTADVRQHGFARYREALAGSYNLAAIHTLKRVGVRAAVDRLRRAGLSTLDAADADYGPDFAIGNAEIDLTEYTGAFAAFANRGRPVHPRAVRSLEVPGGATIRPNTTAEAPPALFSPLVAYQVFDMLSDPDARRPMFGRAAPMELPFPVALKTGTTRAYTDNLALGTTREFTVGAWAGNFDGSPTDAVMAMQGAAPIVRAAFVSLAALYGDPTPPAQPSEAAFREVCALSGHRPGAHCPSRKREIFSPESARAHDQSAPCAFHVHRCGQASVAFPPELANWARAHNLPDANRLCPTVATATTPTIVFPADGARFRLDAHRPARNQRPPLRTLPENLPVRLTIDGRPASQFQPQPGRHLVRADWGRHHDQVEITFE